MAEKVSGLGHLDGVKRFVARNVLQQVLRYIDKDPEHNVERILELGERLALLPWHKEGIRNIRTSMAEHPAIVRYIHRLCTEVDPHVRRTLSRYVNTGGRRDYSRTGPDWSGATWWANSMSRTNTSRL